jgi:peptide/nickel transport system permease protein
VLILVSFATTFLLNLVPGGPANGVLGDTATPQQIQAFNKEFGLDRPVVVRYLDWLRHAVTGDLGTSFQTRQPVSTMIGQRLPVTLEITLIALGFALIMAVPLGVLQAYLVGGKTDRSLNVVMGTFIATPTFLIAIFFSYFISVKLGWLPVAGWTPFSQDPVDNLRHIILPSLALALAPLALFCRLIRSDMIATLQSDFILAARGRGQSTRSILFREALKPSSFSLITVAALSLGQLLGGAVVVEVIFSLPGIGTLLYSAITLRDYGVVQGVVVFIALVYVALNAFVDVVYELLDPRVRRKVAYA